MKTSSLQWNNRLCTLWTCSQFLYLYYPISVWQLFKILNACQYIKKKCFFSSVIGSSAQNGQAVKFTRRVIPMTKSGNHVCISKIVKVSSRYPSKGILNSYLPNSHLLITHFAVAQSFWNFAQKSAVMFCAKFEPDWTTENDVMDEICFRYIESDIRPMLICNWYNACYGFNQMRHTGTPLWLTRCTTQIVALHYCDVIMGAMTS